MRHTIQWCWRCWQRAMLGWSLAVLPGVALAVETHVLPDASDVVELLDSSLVRQAIMEAVREPDFRRDPERFVEHLKQEFRSGALERIVAFAGRLLQVRPNDPAAQALYSISLAARGEAVGARESLSRARNSPGQKEELLLSCAEAMVLRLEGKPEEAVREARKAAAADPTHPYPYNVIGRSYFDLGDTTNALVNFKRAIDLNRGFATGHSNLGAVAYVTGDYAAALQAYARAAELAPADCSARYGLALAQDALGQTDAAIKELLATVELCPGHALALTTLAGLQLRQGLAEEALSSGEKMLKAGLARAGLVMADALMQKGELPLAWQHLTNGPAEDPERRYLQGYWFMASDRFPEALTCMEAVVQTEPNHLGAAAARAALKLQLAQPLDPLLDLTNRWSPELGRLLVYIAGAAEAAKGDWSAALDHYVAAEGVAPGFSMTGIDAQTLEATTVREEGRWVTLGLLLYLKNLPGPASAVLARALTANADSPLANYWAGTVHLRRNEREKALRSFERATQRAPRYFAALYAAGELHFRAGNPQKAAEFYERAQAVKPEVGLALRLGSYYEHTAQLERAEAAYRQVIKQAPEFYVGYNQLAWLLAKRGGKLDEALLLATRANELMPGNGSVLDTLGWIQFQQSRLDLAQTTLENAVRVKPSDPTIWYHLGVVHQARKDIPAAKAALEKALGLSQNFEELADARRLLQSLR